MFSITYTERSQLRVLVRSEMTRIAEFIANDVVQGNTPMDYYIEKYAELQDLYRSLQY